MGGSACHWGLHPSRRKIGPSFRAGFSHATRTKFMRCLMVIHASTAPAPPVLCKGQRWDIGDQQMRIYRVGIHLVEFRLFKVQDGAPQPRLGRSSLEPVGTVLDYLQKRHAVLSNGPSTST